MFYFKVLEKDEIEAANTALATMLPDVGVYIGSWGDVMYGNGKYWTSNWQPKLSPAERELAEQIIKHV